MESLIDTIVNILIIAFLLRWFENTLNLRAYHAFYQLLIKVTSPVMSLFGRQSGKNYSALWCVVLSIAVKALFYMSNSAFLSSIHLVGASLEFPRADLFEAVSKSCLTFLLFVFKGISVLLILGILVDYKQQYDNFFRVVFLLVSPFEKISNLILKYFNIKNFNFRYQRLISLAIFSFVFAFILYLVLILNQGRIVLTGPAQINLWQLFCLNLFMVINVFDLFVMLLLIRAISSWFATPYDNKVLQIIYIATDELVKPFERLNLSIGMIDFSLMVALFAWGAASRLAMGIVFVLYSAV